jgi:hypothetical protein
MTSAYVVKNDTCFKETEYALSNFEVHANDLYAEPD